MQVIQTYYWLQKSYVAVNIFNSSNFKQNN